jgi:hypothetical protein
MVVLVALVDQMVVPRAAVVVLVDILATVVMEALELGNQLDLVAVEVVVYPNTMAVVVLEF